MFVRFSLILVCSSVPFCCGCSKADPVAPSTSVVKTPVNTSPVDAGGIASTDAVHSRTTDGNVPAQQDVTSIEVESGDITEPPSVATSVEPNTEPKAAQLTRKEMLKLAGTGVVLVTVFDALGEKVGFGSGCIVGEGLILTNYHVISAGVTAQVRNKGDGEELLGTAVNVVGYRALDEINDLALLQVLGLPENLHVFNGAVARPLEQFDEVFAIGHPDGLKFSTTSGFVNGLLKTSDLPEQISQHLKSQDTEWIQTDAVIAGGSSGGPLLNQQGEIVGINTLRLGDRISLAVGGRHVKELLGKQLEAVSPLPVPDAEVLTTKAVAEISQGYQREFQQLVADIQRVRSSGNAAKMQELIRRNNPGPACIQRCQELVRKHRGQAEAVDAIRLCAQILTANEGRLNAGRHYLDELLEAAARDPGLIPASARVLNSLYLIPYSVELDHYLRSVINGDAENGVKAAAGVVLVTAMSVANQTNLEGEFVELALDICERFGDERFQGAQVKALLPPVIERHAFSIGSLAPEIVGMDEEGREFRLSDYRGKVVVLDFWADWCPHCRQMYPQERKLVERMKEKPFVILGVNGDEPDRAKRVIQSGSVTWRSWLDGPTGPIAKQWKIQGWPTLYVLDQAGRIRFEGARGDELDAAVESLLHDAPFPTTQEFLAASAEWKFHTPKGADESSEWHQADFDDATWASGRGPFGDEVEIAGTKLERGPSGTRPLATLFRHKFDLPAAEIPARLLLRLRYREGVAVFLNGQEVYRDQLKSDAEVDSPALARAPDRHPKGVSLAIDSSLLKPTNNCFAIELHQFSAYSTAAHWELSLGRLPDLPALLANATIKQKSEICRLIAQVGQDLPGSDIAVKQFLADESPSVQLLAAVAAAMNGLPITLTEISDPDAAQSLALSVLEMNRQAWNIVERNGFSNLQYAEALRQATAANALLPLIHKQFGPMVQGVSNTLAVALYRSGQSAKAQAALKNSIDVRGDNPVDVAYLVLVLQQLGETDEANKQRSHLVKLLASDDWKHDLNGKMAKEEVDRVFVKSAPGIEEN